MDELEALRLLDRVRSALSALTGEHRPEALRLLEVIQSYRWIAGSVLVQETVEDVKGEHIRIQVKDDGRDLDVVLVLSRALKV